MTVLAGRWTSFCAATKTATSELFVNIKPDDSVRVKRDISRAEDKDYAKAGQTGVVLEVFRNGHQSGNHSDHRPWYAKVLIGGKVKTFRLTSIEPVGAVSENADHSS